MHREITRMHLSASVRGTCQRVWFGRQAIDGRVVMAAVPAGLTVSSVSPPQTLNMPSASYGQRPLPGKEDMPTTTTSDATAELLAMIVDRLEESAQVKHLLASTGVPGVVRLAELLVETLRGGHKVMLFGNGGSAADAQHIAAEFVGRFMPDRMPLPAISLSTDTSILTALGNDYGYHAIFARQIEALGAAGDVAIGISTSGNSP